LDQGRIDPAEITRLAKAVYFHPHLLGNFLGYTRLTKMHSGWIRYIWCPDEVPDLDGKFDSHRALMAHRGAYKTTAVVEVGSIWRLLFWPEERIAIIRKTHTDAAKVLYAVRQHFKREKLRDLFALVHGEVPRFIVDKDNTVTFSFKREVTREGNITCHGINASITGSHYDKILPDDIVTLKDRLSKAERYKTKEYIRELLTNIIDPGKTVGFTGTPWHQDDAWSMEGMPRPDKWDTTRAGLLTDDEIAEKRKTTTPLLFAINYDLKFIADEDAIFTDPSFVNWNWKGVTQTYAHIDAKYAGDHTGALTIMSRRPGTSDRYQARGWMFYEDFSKDGVLENVVVTCAENRARTIYLETNADKGFGGKELRRVITKLFVEKKIKHCPMVKDYHESANKDIKIQTYLLKSWRKIDWENHTNLEYMAQITDYREKQEPNDAPDSVASLLREKFYPAQAGGGALWSK